MQDSLQLRSLFITRLDDDGDTVTSGLTHQEGIGQDDVQGSVVLPCPSPFMLQGHRSVFVQDQQPKSWNCTSEDLLVKSRMQASPTSTTHNFSYPDYSAFCAPATTYPPQLHQGYRVETQRKAASLNAQPVLATVNKNHHFPTITVYYTVALSVSAALLSMIFVNKIL